jgi:hypothetical protein
MRSLITTVALLTLLDMRTRLLLSAALLAVAILLVFRAELHARGRQCGFWGSMEDGCLADN